MSGSSKDIDADNPESLDQSSSSQVELSGSLTGKSSRTSISFITNTHDQKAKKEILEHYDPMDEDEDEDVIAPDMTLKEFIDVYLTGPRSMKTNLSVLMKELVDTREGFSQARSELQNSKNDIGVIHSQFFESKRNHDMIQKELNESKLESEKLKADIQQMRIEQAEKLNELSYKMEQLSRVVLHREQQVNNNKMMMSGTPQAPPAMQYYPSHPQPHYMQPSIQLQPQLPPQGVPQIVAQQPQPQPQQLPPPDVPSHIKTEIVDPYQMQQIQLQQQASVQQVPSHHRPHYVPHDFQPPNPTSSMNISPATTATTSTSDAPQLPGADSSNLASPTTGTLHRQAQESDRQSPKVFKYALLKQITSIRQIWQEYSCGLNGQPSIKSLQIKYKTKWRYPEDASTFKRRKRIYKAIEIAMLNGLTEDEAITELENHRLDKEGNYRRSLQWLCDNIPEKFKGN